MSSKINSEKKQQPPIFVNRYLLEKKIGEGGTGAVYKAIDTKNNRPVAIKEIDNKLLLSEEEKKYGEEIFKREVEMLKTLDHPSLPYIKAYFTRSTGHYLVLEYIEGLTLEEIAGRIEKGFINEEIVKDWALQLCEVLYYLHIQDPPVIYRDLKPSNVILEESGNIKLIDFGISRKFKPGKESDTIPFFTEGYAPPEQYRKQTDVRSDIYSLGATIHHLITKYEPKKSPFCLPPVREINKHISEEFESVIMKALCIKPQDRWQTIKDFYKAIKKTQNKTEEIITKISFLKGLFPEKKAPEATVKKRRQNIIVSNSSDGDFQSINEAIKEAYPGNTILVNPGVYRESIKITKDILIIGNGHQNEILIRSNDKYAISMRTYKAIIKNLTIHSSADVKSDYPVIDVPQGHLTLDGCNIGMSSNECITVHGATSTLTARKCTLHNCEKGGIAFYEKGTGTVEKCDIFSNFFAIEISDTSTPVIKQCKIRNCDYGVYIYEKGFGAIEECDIIGSGTAGILIKEHGNPLVKNCNISYGKNCGIYVSEKGAGQVENCQILFNEAAGIIITDKGNPIIKNCKIKYGNQYGIDISKKGKGSIEGCEILENKKVDINIESNCRPSIINSKYSNNIDCFITTATCLSLQKGDRCHELNSFRKFRDEWLTGEKDGKKLIEEYYSIAPNIVEYINKSYNKKTIYENIWNNYLSKCLYFIEEKKYDETKKIYIKMVKTLKKDFYPSIF